MTILVPEEEELFVVPDVPEPAFDPVLLRNVLVGVDNLIEEERFSPLPPVDPHDHAWLGVVTASFPRPANFYAARRPPQFFGVRRISASEIHVGRMTDEEHHEYLIWRDLVRHQARQRQRIRLHAQQFMPRGSSAPFVWSDAAASRSAPSVISSTTARSGPPALSARPPPPVSCQPHPTTTTLC